MEKYVKWEEFKDLMKKDSLDKDWFGNADASAALRHKTGMSASNAQQILIRAKLGKLKRGKFLEIKEMFYENENK